MKKILLLLGFFLCGFLLWFLLQAPVSHAPTLSTGNKFLPAPSKSNVIITEVNVIENPKVIFDTLKPGDKITSPFVLTGKARGNWYFEASLPVQLLDGNGNQLALEPATALSNWMTTNWVPFTVTLNFLMPATPTGTLVVKKDNPSGLPVNDDQYSIPVSF